MASNTNLGGIFMTDTDGNLSPGALASSENVCGLIFDTSIVGGLTAALGEGQAKVAFKDGNVVELNTSKDAVAVGLVSVATDDPSYDESALTPLELTPFIKLAAYHVEKFFQTAGSNQRLFVSFMNSNVDTRFEAIEKMQLAASGIIYQIGVWTAKPTAVVGDNGYEVNSDGPIQLLQAQAEVIGGKIGYTNYDGNSPANIILNAPVLNQAIVDYNLLPDFTGLNCPKVTYAIGQEASDNVHELQLDIDTAGTEVTYVPVGNIGLILGVLALAPAENSIAYVGKFNLGSIFSDTELGFGNLTIVTGDDEVNSWSNNVSFTNIKTIGYVSRNNKLHKKGLVFLVNYDGMENAIFFSSDQTLSTGDYRSLSRCRVIHKSRRVVRIALLPYVNAPFQVNSDDGTLSDSAITVLQNAVIEALDANMVEPGTTVSQISARNCTVDPDQNVLENDAINIDYRLQPVGCASVINVTEGFAASITD